jgi:hypothetical protein
MTMKDEKKFGNEVSLKWNYWTTLHANLNWNSIKLDSNSIEEKWDTNYWKTHWNFANFFHHLQLQYWGKKGSKKNLSIPFREYSKPKITQDPILVFAIKIILIITLSNLKLP